MRRIRQIVKKSFDILTRCIKLIYTMYILTKKTIVFMDNHFARHERTVRTLTQKGSYFSLIGIILV